MPVDLHREIRVWSEQEGIGVNTLACDFCERAALEGFRNRCEPGIRDLCKWST